MPSAPMNQKMKSVKPMNALHALQETRCGKK